MKTTRTKGMWFAAILVVILMFVCIIGCSPTEEQNPPTPEGPTAYTVTVTGGTADKTSAAEGEKVKLTPGAVTGSTFKNWTVSAGTLDGDTLTMPASDVTVTAVFEKIDYTVTVNGGTADKTTANYNDTVTLTVGEVAEGKEFSHWIINGAEVEGNSFTMPAENVTVEAVITNLRYAVTVVGGTADKKRAEMGDTVALTPNAPETGYEFTGWTVDADGVEITGNSFAMPAENVTITAVFEKIDYTVTVENGTADKTTANYGDTVMLTANEAPIGQQFKQWQFTVDGVTVTANAFTMPASNVTVTAVYEKIAYTVTVTGGSASKTTANYEDIITLTPNAPETGYEFTGWTVSGGTLDGNTLTMPAGNVTVTAEFAKIDYTVTVTGGTAVATAHYGDTVTLTATPDDDQEFYYWSVDGNQIDGDTFTMPAANVTATATFINLVKITHTVGAIDFIYREASGTVATERNGTAFGASGDYDNWTMEYVKFYIYDSADADTDDYLGYFKSYTDGRNATDNGYIKSHDDKVQVTRHGPPTGGWVNDQNGFWNLMKYELGYDFCAGKTYYFAVQAISKGGIKQVDGEYVRYLDSDISAICTYSGSQDPVKNPVVQDATKSENVLNITVENGLINGDTSMQAGVGNAVKLSASVSDTQLFAGWYAGETLISNSYDYDYTIDAPKGATTLTITAKFVDENSSEVSYLPTPENSDLHIKFSGGGSFEIDRFNGSNGVFFTDARVDYVKIYMYESAAATESVGAFRMVLTGVGPFWGRLQSLDGAVSYNIVRGNPKNNFYVGTGEFEQLRSLFKYVLGVRYSPSKNYHFAVQLCTNQVRTILRDGGTTSVGTNAMAFGGGTAAAECTVTVQDLEGGSTTTTAYVGSTFPLNVTVPEGKVAAWYKVDGESSVFIGFNGMRANVTGNMTLRYILVDESAIGSIGAPDNSQDQMMLFKTGTGTIEYDRQKNEDGSAKTAFVGDADTLIVHVYLTDDTSKGAAAWFKIVRDGNSAYMCTLDGRNRWDMLGNPGNLYTPDGNAHNHYKDYIKEFIYQYFDLPHYLAFQAVNTSETDFAASAIGSVGTGWGNI